MSVLLLLLFIENDKLGYREKILLIGWLIRFPFLSHAARYLSRDTDQSIEIDISVFQRYFQKTLIMILYKSTKELCFDRNLMPHYLFVCELVTACLLHMLVFSSNGYTRIVIILKIGF